jgi:hypothetical protein
VRISQQAWTLPLVIKILRTSFCCYCGLEMCFFLSEVVFCVFQTVSSILCEGGDLQRPPCGYLQYMQCILPYQYLAFIFFLVIAKLCFFPQIIN